MKKELSLFEQMGGTYIEIDGVLYPNLVLKRKRMPLQESTELFGCVIWKKIIRCDM